MHEKMNQCQRILKYIDDYGSITTLQAFQDLGVTRLASRIHDLRKRGYVFHREFVESENRYGETVRYKKYSFLKLDSGED